MGATHVEKSTVADSTRANKLNAVSGGPQTGATEAGAADTNGPQACSILDPDCEACQ